MTEKVKTKKKINHDTITLVAADFESLKTNIVILRQYVSLITIKSTEING